MSFFNEGKDAIRVPPVNLLRVGCKTLSSFILVACIDNNRMFRFFEPGIAFSTACLDLSAFVMN